MTDDVTNVLPTNLSYDLVIIHHRIQQNRNNYIITPSNSCADISDTEDLSSEQINPEEVRIIAFFDNCDLDSAVPWS